MQYQEYDTIRTLEPVDAYDVAEDGLLRHFPAGTKATIVLVHARGQAYEVEFVTPFDNPDQGAHVALAALTPNQFELAN